MLLDLHFVTKRHLLFILQLFFKAFPEYLRYNIKCNFVLLLARLAQDRVRSFKRNCDWSIFYQRGVDRNLLNFGLVFAQTTKLRVVHFRNNSVY